MRMSNLLVFSSLMSFCGVAFASAPQVQSVPVLGGWGLALLGAGVAGVAVRWFRSRDRD